MLNPVGFSSHQVLEKEGCYCFLFTGEGYGMCLCGWFHGGGYPPAE